MSEAEVLEPAAVSASSQRPRHAREPKGPYPGLRPFKTEESSIFFGREEQCDILVQSLETGNVLLIHGASGCGKSSLVGAGLLPTLRRDYARDGQVLRDATFRPSSGPYEALARALADTLQRPDGGAAVAPQTVSAEAHEAEAFTYWGERLLNDADIVATMEARLDAMDVDGLCLVVDQFEEIFTWARDRRGSDVERLVAFLAAVRNAETDRIFVLLTMRSDFLGACGRYPVLTELFNKSQYLLPVLGVSDIARAIIEPARLFGGEIEPELLDGLLRIATTGTDPLPVVQHALKRMYDLWPRSPEAGWRLTLADLDAVSGTSNPLSTHADTIAAEIEKDGKPAEQALQWLFRALFDVEKTGEAVRRPRDFGELAAVSGLVGTEASVVTRRIVDAFAEEGANLLTVSSSYPPRIDISHEALLRQWTRIAGGGQEQSNWKRREIEDGQLWRSFASEFRDDLLSARSLEIARTFFDRMRAAPERARRYLTEDTDIQDVRLSHEWRRIETLIQRSLKRQRLKRLGWSLAVIGLLAGASLNYIHLQLKANSEQLVKAEARQAAQQQKIETILEESTGASLESEQVDPNAAQILEEVADGRFDRSGYVWIGNSDERIATLETRDGVSPVTHSTIISRKCYAPRYVLALRSDMPDPLNRSASRIGSVRVGQRVCALESPQKADASDQWWLHVATITVYIHINSPRLGGLDNIEKALTRQNYLLPGTQFRSVPDRLYAVRYCYPEEKSAAASLALYLTQQLSGPKFTTENISYYNGCARATPGFVDVWIDTQSLGWGSLNERGRRSNKAATHNEAGASSGT